MVGLVNLVIPLRDVAQVEKAESCPNGSNTIDQAVRFVMRAKNVSVGKEFIFAQLPDRQFIMDKLDELMGSSRNKSCKESFNHESVDFGNNFFTFYFFCCHSIDESFRMVGNMK